MILLCLTQSDGGCLSLQVMRSYREASVVTDTLADLSVLLNFTRVWDPASYKAKQYTVAQLRKDILLLRWASVAGNCTELHTCLCR